MRKIMVAVACAVGFAGCMTGVTEDETGTSGSGSSGAAAASSSGGGSSSASSASSSSSSSSGGSSGASGMSSSTGGPCDFETPGSVDKPRVVVTSHPFAETPGQDLTEIRSLTLGSTGLPEDNGMRLDVGVVVKRMEFVPGGQFLMVLGEDGDLVSVSVNGANAMAVVDQVTLPDADFQDMVMRSDGRVVWPVGFNSVATGGISTVHVACDGSLTVEEDAFASLRLTESFALMPGGQRAVVLGGQAVFEPVDTMDTRLFSVSPAGFAQVAAFDLWSDFIDTARIGLSPAGDLLVVPNSSPFSTEGSQIRVFTISGDVIAHSQTLEGVSSVREALFSPDGATVLVSRDEANRVMVYRRDGDMLTETEVITGIGLASTMVMVTRGPRTGLVLVPSTDTSGASNIALLQINGAGNVDDLGQVDLGGGFTNIPEAVAVQP